MSMINFMLSQDEHEKKFYNDPFQNLGQKHY